MQFDREKSFGYPVLRPVFLDEDINNMDFPGASFEPVFSLEVSVDEPDVATLEYEFSVSVPEIEKGIKNGQLSIMIDVSQVVEHFLQRNMKSVLRVHLTLNSLTSVK